MDSPRFDALTRRLSAARLTRTAALRSLTVGALAAVGASALPAHDTSARKKKKKKPVCLCPTADATGCTTRKVKKQQVRKLATQACNYAGTCRAGVIGPQCLCPSGQTVCGQNCVNLQRDAANCGACGTACAPGRTCAAGLCCLPATANLQAAVAATTAGSTLRLCAGTWTVGSTVGIARNLTLVGAGTALTTLDGDHAVRVLQVAAGVEVTLRDLTITRGKASESAPNDGGGIYTEGTLSLRGVAVTNSSATNGGGIFNSGTLTLQDGNSVAGNEAGAAGGGIFNSSTLTLQGNSRVADNDATAFGGGIYNLQGTLTLAADSRVAGNEAGTSGGGIYTNGGSVTLQDDSLVGGTSPQEANTTALNGGGIATTGGSVTLWDSSRVVGNDAGSWGGGISTNGGAVALHAGSGVTGNRADAYGGIYANSGTVTVALDALVCNNTPLDNQCGGSPPISRCPNPAATCPPA